MTSPHSLAIDGGPFLATDGAMVKLSETLPHHEITSRIIGCFYEVYGELGAGFSERVFRRALFIALHDGGLHAEEEARLQVRFRGTIIGTFWVDLVVEHVVLVEIKALPELDDRSVGQLLNYLKAAGGGVGLLLNFGRRPEFKRRIVGDGVTVNAEVKRTHGDSEA